MIASITIINSDRIHSFLEYIEKNDNNNRKVVITYIDNIIYSNDNNTIDII